MGQRSTSRSISDDDTLVVGEIRGPHGVRGEVRLDPRSDVEGRFAPGATLDCDGIGPLTITSLRGTPGQPIVAFDGYTTREQAATLKDRFLRVPKEEARRKLVGGAILWADLVGLAVETPDGERLGTVRELIRAGGADVLVVKNDERELLLPMIDSVVRRIDVAAGKIVATPLEGLE
jgi:16S rRNA processing protein RimM